MNKHAFVRAVPDSFDRAIVAGSPQAIDVDLARTQHRHYTEAIADAGYEIVQIPDDEALPDCPFIEDIAVVLDGAALVTRPGAKSRAGEPAAVASVLDNYFDVVEMEPPGTLDGGDVLRMGRTLYVGRSARTNSAGIEQLSEFTKRRGYQTVPVAVRNVLHLKSAILALDPETLLLIGARQDVGLEEFASYRIVAASPDEVRATSALALGDGTVLITASSPRTAESTGALGFDIEPIDVSEFQTADGGLTCLSILSPLPH